MVFWYISSAVDLDNIDNMSRRKKPEAVAKYYIAEAKDQPGFELKFIDEFIGMYDFCAL